MLVRISKGLSYRESTVFTKCEKGGGGATIYLSKACVVHLTVPFILPMPIQILTMEPLYCSRAATQNVEESDEQVDSTQSEKTHEE